VTAGHWNPLTAGSAGRSRLRASDADREQAIDTLKAAFAHGRLSRDDLAARTGQVLASRTLAELAAITAGIPAGPGEARPLRRPAPAYGLGRIDFRTVAWAVCLLLMPATLGAEFVTYSAAFGVLFVLAFIGVTITAKL
jgi:hypothetical protein